MIYLYRVSGKDIHIRHTGVMHDSRIHVAVLDDSFDENVIMSLALPEFTLTSNKLDQADCYMYLNFIIEKYEYILKNLKGEKDLKKFFKRGDKLMIDEDLTNTEEYYKFIRFKANKIIGSYEKIGMSPLKRVKKYIRQRILSKY